MLTKVDLYNDGLSGGADSSARRERLLVYLGLPRTLSANALIEAVNVIFGYDAYSLAVSALFSGENAKSD